MAKIEEKLAEWVPSWGARLAYGEKTTVDGQELVPAAVVAFGFGAGEGSGDMPEGGTGPTGHGEGSGGGGGGFAVPIGAYVAGSEGLRFQPNPVVMAVVAVPLITAVGWVLAGIVLASRARSWR